MKQNKVLSKSKILIMGPQGSGKSTQAKLLAKALGLPYLSTGDIFRRMAKEESPLGREIKNLIENGFLVDDKTTIKIINEFLAKPEFKQGFVAEGFPRNLFQAEKFKDVFDKVFFLKVSREEIMKRLSSRRICEKCKANFNLLTKPPKREGVCDFCGGGLVQRKDDTKEAVKKRLKIYQELTQPVLDFYRQKGILKEIDGERPIEVISEEILSRV